METNESLEENRIKYKPIKSLQQEKAKKNTIFINNSIARPRKEKMDFKLSKGFNHPYSFNYLHEKDKDEDKKLPINKKSDEKPNPPSTNNNDDNTCNIWQK